MKALVWIPVGLGAGLAVWGLVSASKVTENKAEDPVPGPLPPGVIPEHDANVVPKHMQGQNDSQPSYCQLLTAYENELKKWQTMRDNAESRMRNAERQAQAVCHDFAQEATWTYDYGGIFGTAGWTTLIVTRPAGLKVSCTDYVKGIAASPGNPRIKAPPTRGANIADNSWPGVADRIRKIQQQVESARAALPAIRDAYLSALQERDLAQRKINELQAKLADLEAQGVFC